MGIILLSETTAGEITDLIASQLRAKLCTEVINSKSKIALKIDESTTIHTKSVLILYLRTVVCYQVSSFFLDLVELSGNGTNSITSTLLNTLASHGFTHEALLRTWLRYAERVLA